MGIQYLSQGNIVDVSLKSENYLIMLPSFTPLANPALYSTSLIFYTQTRPRSMCFLQSTVSCVSSDIENFLSLHQYRPTANVENECLCLV